MWIFIDEKEATLLELFYKYLVESDIFLDRPRLAIIALL